MEKSWNKLADRCELYADVGRSVFTELLKEGEEVLAQEVNLYEQTYTLGINPGFDAEADLVGRMQMPRGNVITLPDSYKSMICVWVDGNQVPLVSHKDVMRDDENFVLEGLPNGYYMRGNRLYFDTAPGRRKIMVEYNSTIVASDQEKYLPVIDIDYSNPDKVKIPTTLGSLLNGSDFTVYGQTSAGSFIALRGTSMSYISNSDIRNVQQLDESVIYGNSLYGGEQYQKTATQGFTLTGADLGTSATPIIGYGATIAIHGYRDHAPVIPSKYHLSLCDYALSVALAKDNPQKADKHAMFWEKSIERITNQEADAELIHSVRREI